MGKDTGKMADLRGVDGGKAGEEGEERIGKAEGSRRILI
jgi:hypothetical protein